MQILQQKSMYTLFFLKNLKLLRLSFKGKRTKKVIHLKFYFLISKIDTRLFVVMQSNLTSNKRKTLYYQLLYYIGVVQDLKTK